MIELPEFDFYIIELNKKLAKNWPVILMMGLVARLILSENWAERREGGAKLLLSAVFCICVHLFLLLWQLQYFKRENVFLENTLKN